MTSLMLLPDPAAFGQAAPFEAAQVHVTLVIAAGTGSVKTLPAPSAGPLLTIDTTQVIGPPGVAIAGPVLVMATEIAGPPSGHA